MEDNKEFNVDYFVEKAKRLVGPNPPKMSQEQIEYIVNQCRELVRPRTDEERAKISEQFVFCNRKVQRNAMKNAEVCHPFNSFSTMRGTVYSSRHEKR